MSSTSKDGQDYTEQDIENIVNILDGFGSSDIGRLKLKVDPVLEAESFTFAYHHGRCDIGSPYAKGDCFDAPDGACDRK
ncbi:MAG: hypothetical protein K6G12_08260 [Lachnospiraceae bacterium]|nr:hypothetical protein [Lachnospiraceae bacterium]